MIIATLYSPQDVSATLLLDKLGLQNTNSLLAPSIKLVATTLKCSPELVDVLASGEGYMAFSIFDCEDGVNAEAMVALSQVTGYQFDENDGDTVIRGPVLLIQLC